MEYLLFILKVCNGTKINNRKKFIFDETHIAVQDTNLSELMSLNVDYNKISKNCCIMATYQEYQSNK